MGQTNSMLPHVMRTITESDASLGSLATQTTNPDTDITHENTNPVLTTVDAPTTPVSRTIDVTNIDLDKVLKEENEKKKATAYIEEKNRAKGLVDIALLTANCDQLARADSFGSFHSVMLILCIIIQVVAAILLIIVQRIDSTPEPSAVQQKRKYWYNGAISLCMLFIIVFNIVSSSFSRNTV